jgi:hypothetical protein
VDGWHGSASFVVGDFADQEVSVPLRPPVRVVGSSFTACRHVTLLTRVYSRFLLLLLVGSKTTECQVGVLSATRYIEG